MCCVRCRPEWAENSSLVPRHPLYLCYPTFYNYQMAEESGQKVPIVVANFAPLRFVLRNKKDTCNPSIEQINSRTYDYVKLHRLSTFFDVGIRPFSLGVCFDGTLVLPSLPKFQEREKAMALFNRTLAELLIGGVYCETASPDDISYGSMTFTSYTKIRGGGTGPAASFHFAARTKIISALDAINLFEPETITVDELTKALGVGRALIQKLGEIPSEQVLYGTTFYVRKQWAESLIHLWTTTERIVELAWHKYVVIGSGKLTKKRRAFLDDHRTWPVSTKLEVLFQKGLLPTATYDMLDAVRKARNEFAHRGIPPSHDIATQALTGCFQLASLVASSFTKSDLFSKVVDIVIERCHPELYPKKNCFTSEEVRFWLPLPLLPGEPGWGDQEYEVIDELRLKLLPTDSMEDKTQSQSTKTGVGKSSSKNTQG